MPSATLSWITSRLDGALAHAVALPALRQIAGRTGFPVLLIATGLETYDRAQLRAHSTLGARQELAVVAALDRVPSTLEEVDVVLCCHGGRATSAVIIAQALRSRFREVRMHIPHAAASAGTLLALSADQILLSRVGYLTRMDPVVSLGGVSLPSSALVAAAERGGAQGIRPELVLDATARLRGVAEQARGLLALARVSEEVQDLTLRRLLLGDGDHDAPVHRAELRALGLQVSPEEMADADPTSREAQRLLARLILLGAGELVALAVP